MDEESHFLIEKIEKKYVTWLFLIINILMYLASAILGEKVIIAGNFNVADVLEKQEYYRLLSSMFLHAGIDHIIGNMIFVVVLGDMLEQEIGHGRFAVVYLLSGIGGNLCSMLSEITNGTFYHSVGASGAACGIMGALLVLVLQNRGRYKHISLKRMLFAIFYLIYSGVNTQEVNNAGHVGGLVMGFLVMALLAFVPQKQQA